MKVSNVIENRFFEERTFKVKSRIIMTSGRVYLCPLDLDQLQVLLLINGTPTEFINIPICDEESENPRNMLIHTKLIESIFPPEENN